MIIDLQNTKPVKNEKHDVCIIGAGAAGITLALQLSSYGKSVLLCEAGNKDFSEESQSCYRGKVKGDQYYNLDEARLRYLGGSTNHWAGMCYPFRSIDFQRDYMGEIYQWPISKKDLDPFLPKACEILDLDSDFSDIPVTGTRKDIAKIQMRGCSYLFMAERYGQTLKENDNIQLYLNSNLVDISVNQHTIQQAHFVSYNHNKLTVDAKQFIFAMGGIENSRFLLWFHERYGDKLFKDLPVGQYWMEHPHATIGQGFLKKQTSNQTDYYALSEEMQKKEKILGAGIRVNKMLYSGTKKLITDLACTAPTLGKEVFSLLSKDLVCGVAIRAAWEQEPSKDNKITLSTTSKDKFGIPRPVLHWKKSKQDLETIQKSMMIFNQWMIDNDLGRIKFRDWVFKGFPKEDLGEIAGYHHLGGTRMHADPKLGVVDKTCKVHSLDNLFMAGSSVFTTGSAANPTLTIVQMAIRLAEHLKNETS